MIRLYCSSKCYHSVPSARKITKVHKCECEVCGKSFEIKYKRDANKRYCSIQCRHNSQTGKPRTKIIDEYTRCMCCGKEYHVKSSSNGYCSNECWMEMNIDNESDDKPESYYIERVAEMERMYQEKYLKGVNVNG